MWITCYADASFKAAEGGAWAVWLRGPDGRVVKSGRCPPYVLSSHAAELCAIYAGVHLAGVTWAGRVRGVLVCSDSTSALAAAAPGARLSKDQGTRRLQELLRAAVQRLGVELALRWVKGHRPVRSSAQAFLNAVCDKLARRAREKEARRPEPKRQKKRRRRRRRKPRAAGTP